MAIDDLSAATDPGETLRVDSRGRINIGRYAAAGTNFIVRQTHDGDIVLSPAVVMTVREFQALGRRDVEAADAVADTDAGIER
jgi:hypothetical protein